MTSELIVSIMTNLITKKYYAEKTEATEKLDVYFAMGRISAEQYSELTFLAEETYKPEEVTEDPVADPVVTEEP